MKKRLLTMVMIISGTFSVSLFAADRMVLLEEAIESDALEIRLTKDLNGIVKGRRCDECEIEFVTITPATRLEINGSNSQLINAKKRSGKPGVAIYDIKTREVRVIRSYE